jgi:hypothetical protein
MPVGKGRVGYGKLIKGKSEVVLIGMYEVYSRQGL